MAERKLTPRGEFDKALAERAGRFGVEPDEEARARLGDYFELVAAGIRASTSSRPARPRSLPRATCSNR